MPSDPIHIDCTVQGFKARRVEGADAQGQCIVVCRGGKWIFSLKPGCVKVLDDEGATTTAQSRQARLAGQTAGKPSCWLAQFNRKETKTYQHDSRRKTTHQSEGMESPRIPLPEKPGVASPPTLRRRPQARLAHDRRGRGPFSRLLEESHHRRDPRVAF